MLFFTLGLLFLKFSRRIALTMFSMFLIFLFSGIVSGSLTILPLVLVVLSVPFLSLCIKYKRVLAIFFIVIIFLGVFSSTFYSATVTKTTNEEFSDLPYVLNILLEKDPGDSIYCPSSYQYYASRIAGIAHMSISSDPNSSLYLVDKNYLTAEKLESFITNETFSTIFDGNRFVLFERLC